VTALPATPTDSRPRLRAAATMARCSMVSTYGRRSLGQPLFVKMSLVGQILMKPLVIS
jgi:hypothetical protein